MSDTDRGDPDGGLDPAVWLVVKETFLRNNAKVTNALTLVLQSRQEAEDAVSAATFQLGQKLHTIRDRSSPALDAWFRTTAARAAYNERRKARRMVLSGSTGDMDALWKQSARYLSPEVHVEAQEALRFVATLPDGQRTAYVLHHALDLTVSDIADALGCMRRTVRTHLERAQRTIDEKFTATAGPKSRRAAVQPSGRGREA